MLLAFFVSWRRITIMKAYWKRGDSSVASAISFFAHLFEVAAMSFFMLIFFLASGKARYHGFSWEWRIFFSKHAFYSELFVLALTIVNN